MRGEVHIAHIVTELERQDLLPAIVFRTSRSQCDVDAQRASTNKSMRLAGERQRSLRLCVHDIVRRYDMDLELITTHPQYNGLISTGVGAHHAGQLLMWRLLLEELMAESLLRVLVATGTVAAGVDFPARTVVITAHSRRGAEGYSPLTAAEFQQMSGRAGRRGKDAVGFCLAAPAAFCDARQLLRIAKQTAEPLTSAYFPSPSTVLNLLRYRNADDLRYTVDRSLASFVDRKKAKELEQEADALESADLRQGSSSEIADEMTEPEEKETSSGARPRSREEKKKTKKINRLRRQAIELQSKQTALLDVALNGLRKLGYVEESSLSEKGFWAANLCTSIVLELGEILVSGLLDGASAERLAALVGSISADPHRRYIDSKVEVLGENEIDSLEEILKRVREVNMPGIDETRTVIPSAANTVLIWLQAEDWQQFRGLLFLHGVAEGDAARLLTQTAEHLNQLCRLTETHAQLCFRAEEAKRRILRPPLSEVINFEGE